MNRGVTGIRFHDISHHMKTLAEWNELLGKILAGFGCQTGTIHRTGNTPDVLHLVCQIGVPESLMEKIAVIPFGKGIAGAAAERREPVELCNLQENLEGVARPDARKTGVSGSVAVPVFSGNGDRVIGTLGIGKYSPHEFSEEEIARVKAHAAEIAGYLKENTAGD
jgi:L-methionine (R)-S-oxide reductase